MFELKSVFRLGALQFILIACCSAQLTFHTDPTTNSFTLRTPGLQQSFTRYFGGRRGNLMQAPAPLPFQPQQYSHLQQHRFQQQQQHQLQPQAFQYQPVARQPFSFMQPQALQYSSPAQYQASQGQSQYPFEASFEQAVPPAATGYPPAYPSATSFAQAQGQAASYRTQEYSLTPAQAQALIQQQVASQTASSSSASPYAEQLQQQQYEALQQDQMQQQMLQQQQHQQSQLLMDLYKQPQGQGHAVTDSPGRSQAFYTADQYVNFLNRQHQDVFRQQQNTSDRGYSFSPFSAYTNGVPANSLAANGTQQYSPASNVSRVNYTNGKLSYNF